MEYFDILDEEVDKTGEKKLRSEVHRDGDWHRNVHILIVNSKGEALLQHRSKDKDSHPDMWDMSSTGHILAGEEDNESALREIKEEVGIDVSLAQLKNVVETKQSEILKGGSFIDNEFASVYLVQAGFDPRQVKFTDGEVQNIKWVPLAELKKWVDEGKPDLIHRPAYKLCFKAINL